MKGSPEGGVVRDLVSTIIPVHNRPAELAEAVASVLAQEHRPIEVIVVDDGSTDETVQVAASLAEREPERVRVLRVVNGGPGRAREAGRRRARGEFLQYLDSDDVLLPGKFERQVQALRERPEAGVAYGMTRYVGPERGRTDEPWKRTGERIETMFPAFLRSRWWGTSTPLYRREITDAAGPWTRLRNEEDWEYDCRIAAMGVRLAYVPRFVSEQRDHEGPRLSRGGSTDPAKLSDRATAHGLILDHARRAGIPPDDPDMRHFARELFLLARQCGAAGLQRESAYLVDLARDAVEGSDRRALDVHLYGAMARLVGWERLGSWACAADRLRGGRS